MRRTRPLSARLAEKTNRNGPVVRTELGNCWEWTGHIRDNGYGDIQRGRRGEGLIRVHRAAWLVTHGSEPPAGLDVCHQCDNRKCLRPDHLFIGTRSDNMADASRKGRLDGVHDHQLRGHRGRFAPLLA